MCVFFLTCNRSSLVADALMIAIVRTFRCPVVHYLHGRGYSELSQRSRINKHLLRWIFKRADRVVTLTPSLFSDVVSFVDENAVITIPNAIEAAPVAERSCNDERVTALFLSNFDRTKGALDLVLAAQRLAHLRTRMRVVLAGGIVDAAFYEELRREIENRSLQDYVELRGPAYGEEKQRLLAESDVFVFPTYYAFETFGLVNLEAMRAGLPVIATRVGGIPDVVKDGVTGYLIEARDHHALAHHLERLVQDGGLRQRLGQQARARFEANYTFAHFANNWSEALTLLRSGARASSSALAGAEINDQGLPRAERGARAWSGGDAHLRSR
jgi:glycosyltransferase involved in cell wall biosynthesis